MIDQIIYGFAMWGLTPIVLLFAVAVVVSAIGGE